MKTWHVLKKINTQANVPASVLSQCWVFYKKVRSHYGMYGIPAEWIHVLTSNKSIFGPCNVRKKFLSNAIFLCLESFSHNIQTENSGRYPITDFGVAFLIRHPIFIINISYLIMRAFVFTCHVMRSLLKTSYCSDPAK